MSELEALQTEVQGYRDQAGRIADDFKSAHADVVADRNLSVVGRREKLEPLHADVTEKIGALHAREKQAVQGLKEKIERRAFGLTSTAASDPARVVSFRDAQSRARQLDNNADAHDVYTSALRSGDDIMATAVLERALVRGWQDIKSDYLSRNDATRSDLDDLTALAKYSENGLMNAMHYIPPQLDLPYPAGFPDIPALHSRSEPQGPRPLPDWMTR